MKSSKQNRNFGICCSLSAGILWGIVPVYIYIIDVEDPYEIIAHRSLWSAALLFLICWIGGQLGDVWATLKTQRNFYNFFLTAGLLSLNWGIYVYSVQTGQVVAADQLLNIPLLSTPSCRTPCAGACRNCSCVARTRLQHVAKAATRSASASSHGCRRRPGERPTWLVSVVSASKCSIATVGSVPEDRGSERKLLMYVRTRTGASAARMASQLA